MATRERFVVAQREPDLPRHEQRSSETSDSEYEQCTRVLGNVPSLVLPLTANSRIWKKSSRIVDSSLACSNALTSTSSALSYYTARRVSMLVLIVLSLSELARTF